MRVVGAGLGMRLGAVSGAILLLGSWVATLGSVGGQGAPASPVEAVTTDAADDVKLYVAPALSVPPQDASATGKVRSVDILGLKIYDETETSFKVALSMGLIEEQDQFPFRILYFELETVKYAVYSALWTGTAPHQGILARLDPTADWYRTVEALPTQTDTATQTLIFTVPRELITTAHGAPVQFGQTLANVSAEAIRYYTYLWFPLGWDPTGGTYMYDRAPDTGVGTAYRMTKGLTVHGDLMLHSLDPIRTSNGESTTIVYALNLMNHGKRVQRIQVEASDLPAGWSVRVPTILELQPGDNVTFPVILSLPFTHDHGQTKTFEVRATSLGNATNWATVRLGVHWTTTPQPAGHHSKLWLHSQLLDWDSTHVFTSLFPFRNTWMNPTEQEADPRMDDANVPAFFNNEVFELAFGLEPPSVTEWTTEWWFPLSPGLLIGLDFDLSREATFSAKVLHKVPVTESRLNATLFYCDPAEAGVETCTSSGLFGGPWGWEPLASGTSPPRPANAQEVVPYEVSMRLNPKADLVPYQRGANLGLRIVLTTNLPANTIGPEPRPELVLKAGDARTQLDLPLFEYHDPIEQFFENVGSLQLSSLVPFEKPLNPGRTAIFRFFLNNTGDAGEAVRLEVHGENAKWATLVGPADVTIAPGASRPIELAVDAPASARPGERAELFLIAQRQEDPLVVAALRLRATVVEGTEIPDEEATLQEVTPQGSPGFELALLLGALAWVARRRAAKP